eukprot:GHVS01027400.1.p1 GENE.GHVS01027400.1~~GHVS01027400.1.p1  ORF type:complete len:794 (+),score=130.54 GHVS01027400.1:214-2382(+)
MAASPGNRLRHLLERPLPPASSSGGAIAALMGNEDVQAMLKDILNAVVTGGGDATVGVEDQKNPEAVVVLNETDEVEKPEVVVVDSAAAINKAMALLGIPVPDESSDDVAKNVEQPLLSENGNNEVKVDVVASSDITDGVAPITTVEENEEELISQNFEYSAVDDVSSEAVDDGDEGSHKMSALPAGVSGVVVDGLYKTPEGIGRIAQSTVKTLMESVLRIHVIRNIQDFGKPWTTKGEARATGSGFPIANRLIITNAHVASDAHIIRIERPGSPTLWDARVISVAHEPDLCVLTVDEDEFWSGLMPLEFVESPPPSGPGSPRRQDVPELLDGVYVVGYPTGGDSLSVTQGIVSRVEVGYYAHSSAYLLEIQIDAAINPGNSGGPVVNIHGEVVGVAFQGLTKADSIGYIIPVPIVKHILVDIETNGSYTGIVSLGVLIQSLRNPVLQDYLGVTEIASDDLDEGIEANGVVVTNVDERRIKLFEEMFPGVEGIGFKKNDVILALDGHNVAEDGSIHFRNVERVAMNFLLCGHYAGDLMDATVLRDGVVMKVDIPLDVPEYLVPTHTKNVKPRFLMYGGAIFVPLTRQYILDFKKARNRVALSTKLSAYQRQFRTEEQKEIVVLSRLLSSKSTKGYNIQNKQVADVNGVKIRDLQHLAELLGVVEKPAESGEMVKALEGAADRDMVKIGFSGDSFNFVLDAKLAKATDEHLLEFHRMSHAFFL